MPIARTEVPLEDKWNVESLYQDLGTWEKELQTLVPTMEPPFFPSLLAFRGTFHQGPEALRKALEANFDIERVLTKLYTYAHLIHDQDTANDQSKQAFGKITSLIYAFSQEMSWFTPEILHLDEATIQSYLNSSELAPYRFWLEQLIRLKPHTLESQQEELLALSGQSGDATKRAFSALNDADLRFGTVRDSNDNEHDLSHASYGLFQRERDRELRKNSFLTYHQQFLNHENTLCETLKGAVATHTFHAKSRKYASCLEAALYPKCIDVDVYHTLIKTVEENIDALHNYMALRKKILNLDSMAIWDVSCPLTPTYDMRFTYQEAEDLVIESVAPLGKEYQDELRHGLKTGRWVDRYENENKRSGAYSSGCFDSMPYILMNFKGTLRDLMTLAHEVGHSMHSFLSRRHQPYHTSDYVIFVAEVASTFNEELLMRLLMERAQTDEAKAYLISQRIDDIRSTLFRQVLFADFELKAHERIESMAPMTPQILKDDYMALNRKYMGPDVMLPSELAIEWARIPHFYYNFYVYQYATGIAAALALTDRVLSGGDKEREQYLSFLKAGSSDYPIELLRKAGVDMHAPEPVRAAIQRFRNLTHDLSNVLQATC